jgi:hypothetical protein
MNIGALSLIAFLTSAAVSHASSVCGPRPASITVVPLYYAETIDKSLTSDQLGQFQTAVSIPGAITKGLTVAGYTADYTAEFLSEQLPDGRWCSRVQNVVVNFGFNDVPKIYLSRDLQEGSCYYNAVLAHEYEHLKIAQQVVVSGKQWIEKGIRDYLARGGAISTSPDAANQILDQAMHSITDTITSRLYANARTRNLALDTPENYAKLGKQCR